MHVCKMVANLPALFVQQIVLSVVLSGARTLSNLRSIGVKLSESVQVNLQLPNEFRYPTRVMV